MGFRSLNVMNEDRIAPGKRFGPHAHRDMEIITFVLEGGPARRDSMSGAHTVGSSPAIARGRSARGRRVAVQA
jgi:redox-sensitive bicupin YhaK (pirin superfamily)